MPAQSINVGIFIRSLEKGGAEKQSLLLAEYLSNLYPTFLIVFHRGINNKCLNVKYNIIYLEGNFLKKIIELHKYLSFYKITHLFNFLPINNVLGIPIGKLVHIKNLYGGIRGTRYKSRVKMIAQKFLCNYISTTFISNSQSAASAYSKYGFSKSKIIVIHNAVEEVVIKKITHEKFTILSVGRFIEDKDYFTAIKAIGYLINEYPELRPKIIYKIIGYGKLENAIKDFINSEGLQTTIQITVNGIIGDSYSSSDILLNTSIFEGMPNVVMEAMNQGLPIVATDAGDTRYLVKDCVNGYLCLMRDYKGIAEKLYTLLINDSLRTEMGKNSRTIIEENFRPAKVFSSYLNLIKSNET